MSVKLSGLEIVQALIQERYDLGKVELPEQLPSAHQRRHRKMTVVTEKGKFLVKTYSLDLRVLDSLRFQHRLSDHLYANDIPVAHIARAKDGRSIVELDTWSMELQEFVPGGAMPLNSTTLAITSETLGRIHEVCRDIPCPPRDTQKWRFSEVPRTLFQSLYTRAVKEDRSQEVADACNRIGLFLNDASKELSEEKREEFETGLIHGDWHGGNLMFDGNKLTAVVDLEFAGDGCYLEDIAYGISNLCVRTTVEPEKLDMRVDLLLDRYQKHRELSYREMIGLFYAVGVKHIATVSYQTEQHGVIAGYTAAQWIRRLAAQCDWLAEESRKARWGE